MKTEAELLTDRLTRLVDALSAAIVVRLTLRHGLNILLVQHRLRAISGQVAELGARLRAADSRPRLWPLPVVFRADAGETERFTAVPAHAAKEPPGRVRGAETWLLRLLPDVAAALGGELQHLLAEPAMADLARAAPQLGRHLRPLCRMLGVTPPACLRRPPVNRLKRAA